MKALVLKAVASPPRILWGPFLPTLINLGIQFPMMFIAIGIIDINPLVFIFSICAVHAIVILIGMKEPHVSRMIQAFGQSNTSVKNLYKEKGKKFAP